MGKVFNRVTKQYKESVNTPDYKEGGINYDDGNWIINPSFIPDCETKYMVIEGDIIREMTVEEKAIIDYVAPIPEPEPPTTDEIEKEYNLNVANEIALKYTLADEMSLLWKLQTGELTIDSPEIVEQRQTVADAKLKYPKV